MRNRGLNLLPERQINQRFKPLVEAVKSEEAGRVLRWKEENNFIG